MVLASTDTTESDQDGVTVYYKMCSLDTECAGCDRDLMGVALTHGFDRPSNLSHSVRDVEQGTTSCALSSSLRHSSITAGFCRPKSVMALEGTYGSSEHIEIITSALMTILFLRAARRAK